jgi:SAM-dependent methyltransferase
MRVDGFNFDWGCKLIERQSEFQRATTILEIGGGSFARVIALADKYPQKNFYSVDFRYESEAQNNVAKAAVLQNVSFIKIDALETFFAPGLFDFSFSIAVMEHIAQLELFLSGLLPLLKPRGAYCFFQAPFWTCKTGHHYNHGDKHVLEVLNGYEHIRFDAQGMRDYLGSVADLKFDISECVRKIYHRPDLSRLSISETRAVIERSDFVIDSWNERDDDPYEESKAKLALASHNTRYALRDFRVHAVQAKLIHP